MMNLIVIMGHIHIPFIGADRKLHITGAFKEGNYMIMNEKGVHIEHI